MTTLREAAEIALAALSHPNFQGAEEAETILRDALGRSKSSSKLREALAQTEQEPVAWMDRDGDIYPMPETEGWRPPHKLLYTHPPQHQEANPVVTHPPQRKPLTVEEIIKIWNDMGNDPIAPSVFSFIACVRKTEQAHGIA